MASDESESEVSEVSSLLRHRDLSLFLPFILGFTNSNTTTREEPPDEETSERIILINPLTQGMVVIQGTSTLDSLLLAFANNNNNKDGHPPASKASIEAMPSVVHIEEDGECVICFQDWKDANNKVAKEMPCKHRFHADCIHKWLGIHGSCPVCRYKMPVDQPNNTDEERRRVEREIWVSFSFNTRSRTTSGGTGDPIQTHDSVSTDSTPSPTPHHHEMEG